MRSRGLDHRELAFPAPLFDKKAFDREAPRQEW